MGKRGPKSESGGNVTNINVVQRQRPKPLHGMSDAARRIWKRTVDAYPADHFKPQHLGLLRAYCETEAKYKKALVEIDKSGGEVIEQKNGVLKRNPWCQERDALLSAMTSLGTKLGITRNATTMTKDNQGESKPKSKREGLVFGG
ncbi:MAG: P27 family phage terminase small subunit [Desulfovibrionales bacterium]